MARQLQCGGDATRRTVVSCDPIYQFDAAQIRQRIDETAAEVLEQARQNAHEFVWGEAIPSSRRSGSVRHGGDERVSRRLRARPHGRPLRRREHCPRCRSPTAPSTWRCARTSCFSTASSSTRPSTCSPCASCAAWRAKCGCSRCWRWAHSHRRTLAPVTEALESDGFVVSVERVPYEFQRGGNADAACDTLMRARRRIAIAASRRRAVARAQGTRMNRILLLGLVCLAGCTQDHDRVARHGLVPCRRTQGRGLRQAGQGRSCSRPAVCRRRSILNGHVSRRVDVRAVFPPGERRGTVPPARCGTAAVSPA